MALRIPPGRAGRVWLVARLEIARRGAELLDRKRQVLLSERVRVRAEAGDAQRAWQAAAADAALWTGRTELIDGPGRLELLARHVNRRATIEIAWSNLMGARLPSVRRLVLPDPPPLSALGGSSAAVIAARACAGATRAAARYAIAERADAELSAELRRTARRLRALNERWIPQHEQALARQNLALDEAQREQATHARWFIRHRDREDGRARARDAERR